MGRNIITDALIRAFYLSRVEMLSPGDGLKLLNKAYGDEIGPRLYNEFDLADVPGWFSRLEPEHKSVFLTNPVFYNTTRLNHFPMPTPEQRLDQLEPVISEMLAKQDETAAKVERVSAQVRQLTVVVTNSLTTQSDNIEFLLTQTQQLTEGQARLEQGQTELKQQVNQGFAQIITLINERLK
jgi:hypothetical protein